MYNKNQKIKSKKMISHYKARSRHFVETITDEDYTDNLALLTNTPAQAKSLLHRLEQAARGVVLYMNSKKPEFMCFNQDDAISLNGKPLKLVDDFIYLGSNISSTESIINKCISKAWTTIIRLSTIWKTDFW